MIKSMTPRNTRRRIAQSSLFLLFMFTCMFCSQDDTQVVSTLDNLLWSDEFNSDGAPGTDWVFETGGDGWGNSELQYYTDRSENARVEGGNLVITAIEEEFGGNSYTSARLITKGFVEEQYGRFEARMQLPWGQGIWPAFWMLGADIDNNEWPGAGEIDVMEYRGQEPTIIHGSVHGPGYSGGDAITDEFELEGDRFDTGFHVFGVEWGPNYINYYVDGTLYNQITPEDMPDDGEWVYDKPFFLLINMAVGGTFVGPVSDATVFPQTLLVDYVRIYN